MTDSAKRVEIDVHAEREVKPQENWPHIIEDEDDPIPRVEVRFYDAGTTQWWESGALYKPGDVRKYLVSAGPPEVIKNYICITGKLHIASDDNKPPNATYWEETSSSATWLDSVIFTKALSSLGTHEYTIDTQPNSGEGCDDGFDEEPRTNSFEFWGNTFGLDATALETEWTKATNARRFDRKPIKPIGTADANNRRALEDDQYNIRLKLRRGSDGDATTIVDVNKDLKDAKTDEGNFQIKNPSDAIKYVRNLPQSGKFHVAIEEKGSQTYGHYAEIVGSSQFHVESAPRQLKFGNDWLVPEGIFFPPFDTSDTTNFKVTRVPKFACDAEDVVTSEFLKIRQAMLSRVEVFLMPRLWAYWARQSSAKAWTDAGKYIYYNLISESCCDGVGDSLWGNTWKGCIPRDGCGATDPCWTAKAWSCYQGPAAVTFGKGCNCYAPGGVTYPCPDPYEQNFEVWCGYYCQTARYSGCVVSYDSEIFVPVCKSGWHIGCGAEADIGADSDCYMQWMSDCANQPVCENCQSANAESVWQAWLAAPHHVKTHHNIGIWWDRFPNNFHIGDYLPATVAYNAYFGCKDPATQSLATWYADPSKTQAKQYAGDAGAAQAEIDNIISGVNGLHVIGTVFNTMEFAIASYGIPWYANRKSTPPLKVINEQLYLGNLATNWEVLFNKVRYNPQWYFVGSTPKYPIVTSGLPAGEGGPRIAIPGKAYPADWTAEEIKEWAGESVIFPGTIAADGKDAYEVVQDFEDRMGWGTKFDRPIGIGISPLKAGALVAVIRVNRNEEYFVWRKTDEAFTVRKTGDTISDCLSFDDQTCQGDGYIEQLRGPAGGRKLTHYKVTPELVCMTTEQLKDENGCYAGDQAIDDCFYWPVKCILAPDSGSTALDNEIHVMGSKDWAFTGFTGRVARRGFAIVGGLGAETRNVDSVTI